MSNENHNNWRSKLEELSSLPGENQQDKNVAWDKLHSRMGGKKRSKKAVWYWAAAACILFALMIPAVIFNKKNHQVDNVTIKQKPSEIKTSVATIIDKKEAVENSIPGLPVKNEIIVTAKSNKTESKIIAGNKINKLRLPDTVSAQNIVTETDNTSLQPIHTSSYLTAIIPAKKRLKVVHINELGDPVELATDMAREADKRSFLSIKLANEEVYNNPSVALSKSDFTILKMKLSSN